MLQLLAVSVIWAFSFPIVKYELSGVDAVLLSFLRLTLALLVFLPFVKPKAISPPLAGRLMGVGAVQYGLMYALLFISFQYDLRSHEIALFTLLTPVYVAIIADLMARKWRPRYLLAAVLSVLGASIVVVEDSPNLDRWTGFLILQGSNLCFAFGQVAYKGLQERFALTAQHRLFAWLYLGAVIVTAVMASLWQRWPELEEFEYEHFLPLVYLGVIASGLGFFLWNYGATRVNAGLLAVANNIKVPLAVVVAVAFFDESADWIRLILGAAVIVAALKVVGTKR